MSRRIAFAVMLAASMVPAQQGLASTLSVTGEVMTYTASPGEANRLLIRGEQSNFYAIEDSGATITAPPGSGCNVIAGSDGHLASCDPGPSIVNIDVADGDDEALLDFTLGALYNASSIQGGAGNDILNGGQQVDVLNGGPGQDILSGGEGNDQLNGNTGFDTLFGDDGGDTLSGGDQDDSLVGGPAADLLSGGAGNDRLDSPVVEPSPDAVSGNDELRGDGGDDLFVATAEGLATNGIDTFIGGEGNDTADYSAADSSLALSLDGVANDGGAGNPDNLQPDVEILIGGPFADVLAGSDIDNVIDGRGADDRIFGNGGNDLLIGGEADIGSDTIRGGDGQDQLLGGPGDDGLDGEAGNDTLRSGSGADALAGGGGDDVLEGGPGLDGLQGGDGNDVLRGGALDLVGGDSADTIDGDAGNDVLEGGLGDDSLDGGTGADVLRGGAGNDTARYNKRAVPVFASLDDKANDGQAREADNVARDVEDIRGGTNQDDLIGSQDSNALQSGAGEDYVDGAVGSDDLGGGADRDTVRARDGVRDHVSCGGDVDFAIVDRSDRVDGDCEHVDRGWRNRPRLARSAVTTPVRGKLRLNVSGTRRFVPLKDRVNIPFGSAVDASDGTVKLASVQNSRRRQRGRDTAVATFSEGTFRASQRRSGRPVTNIRLVGGDFGICARSPRRRKGGRKSLVQRLHGSGKGRFETRGRYSATTVRGTVWEVEDRCDGTLTRVLRGSALVEDFSRNRTVVVEAGESYLARPGG